MWLLAMLLTGYSSYALIPIRGDIPPLPIPLSQGDPFSFASYQAREQYGGAPLLYGNTPTAKTYYRRNTRLKADPCIRAPSSNASTPS